MRVLAIDVGDMRCGLALSDASGQHASPLSVVPTQTLLTDEGACLRQVLADWDVAHIVVGLPLAADGSEGPQARHVKALAGRIVTGLDALASYEFFDERFSSRQAFSRGQDLGLASRGMRGKLDSRAAAVFLQEWLDGQGQTMRRVGLK